MSVTFKAKVAGETQVRLKNFQLGSTTGDVIPVDRDEVVIRIEGQLATGDVNRDGEISIFDMILIARHLGETVPADSAVDVNGDGTVMFWISLPSQMLLSSILLNKITQEENT